MSDRDALTAAVVAAPADDLPRLVFADWLDEHGEAARAAFVRDQVRLAKLPPASAEYRTTFRRAADTLKANLPAWVAAECEAFGQSPTWAPGRAHGPALTVTFPKAAPLAAVRFHRGFVAHADLRLSLTADAAPVTALLSRHPVTHLGVALPSVVSRWERVAAAELTRVKSFSLIGPLSEEVADAAFASAALGGVESLTLRGQPVALASERLARSPLAKRLASLRLPVSPKAFKALDRFPHDDRVHTFALLPVSGGRAPPPGVWSHLSAVPFRPTVRRLDLSGCGMGDAGLSVFARGQKWLKLTVLRLAGNGFGDRGWADFARGWRTPELHRLDVSRNALTGRAVDATRSSYLLRTLRVLDLRGNRIDGRAAVALAKAVLESPLEKLLLAGNPLSAGDARAVRSLLGERTDVG